MRPDYPYIALRFQEVGTPDRTVIFTKEPINYRCLARCARLISNLGGNRSNIPGGHGQIIMRPVYPNSYSLFRKVGTDRHLCRNHSHLHLLISCYDIYFVFCVGTEDSQIKMLSSRLRLFLPPIRTLKELGYATSTTILKLEPQFLQLLSKL